MLILRIFPMDHEAWWADMATDPRFHPRVNDQVLLEVGRQDDPYKARDLLIRKIIDLVRAEPNAL